MTERLLVSTYNRVILWDSTPHTIIETRKPKHHHNFYGITWDEKRIYIAEGWRRVPSVYHVFGSQLKHIGTLPVGEMVTDPHQIYWWGGTLYIADSKVDQIVLWDGHEERVVSWCKPNEPTQHLNSIWCNGENFYVAEHRKKRMPKRVMVLDMSFNPLYRIEIPSGAFIKASPHGIHNVYIENGWLYSCSPKALVSFKLDTRETRTITSPLIKRAHYVRGLARTPDKWFVGLSEIGVRGTRHEGDSAILVLDNDFNTLEVISLEDTGGLTEIRAIDGPDLAHNRLECPYK